MFNNFINANDFFEVLRLFKLTPKIFNKILNKIFSGRNQKVKSTWSHIDSPPVHWWNIPEVVSRWNYLITGDQSKNYYDYFAEKYLSRGGFTALSLGCGTGYRELRWAETKKIKSIDAYDLSERRISYANKTVEQKGFDKIIHYYCDDIYKIPVKENYYDVILGEQSLHHFTPLEELFFRVKKMLKIDGYFLINEYVGANRFQWDKEQLNAANELLGLIPKKYKSYWQQISTKKIIHSPSRLRMLLNDPSEAVESENILSLLDKHFERIEIKNYGGTVLQLVFDKIAHNYLNDDEETKSVIKKCFDFEDKLLSAGRLKSDFVFGVFRKKM